MKFVNGNIGITYIVNDYYYSIELSTSDVHLTDDDEDEFNVFISDSSSGFD